MQQLCPIRWEKVSCGGMALPLISSPDKFIILRAVGDYSQREILKHFTAKAFLESSQRISRRSSSAKVQVSATFAPRHSRCCIQYHGCRFALAPQRAARAQMVVRVNPVSHE